MKTVNLGYWKWLSMLTLCVAAHAVAVDQVPETFHDCDDCPEMVAIPDKNYAIGKYEVTFDEWDACVTDGVCEQPPVRKRAEAWGRGTRPVIYVSWDDIQNYIQWISEKTGEIYRLPDEEEWEYACFAGEKTKYCGDNKLTKVAWFEENSKDQTHPVGEKQGNAFGIHDMSGNIWEWTDSCGTEDCLTRKLKGGGWLYDKKLLRPSESLSFVPGLRSYSYGFRVAREVTQ